MCEYCENREVIKNVKGNATLRILRTNLLVKIENKSFLFDNTLRCGFEVKYCPMCGRSLHDKESGV
jgi:hypothetical protein